jgi:hypothetical protein
MILFEDSQWLVVNKPTGIATHGGRPGDIGAQEWLDLHLDRKTFVCSRLDIGTSGVLIFAKTKAASGLAQKIHESDSATKEYVLESHATSDRGEWSIEGTAFRKIGPARYRATIHRGKTHQIRKHAQASGIPILGDEEYGGRAAPRLYLHCEKLSWPGVPAIAAPLPPGFENPAHACIDYRLDWLSSITNTFRVRSAPALDRIGGAQSELTEFYPNEPDDVIEHGLRYPASKFPMELRNQRRWVFKNARGKKVAVVQASYTLALAAAAGGAEVVFLVDAAFGAAKKAFAMNGLRAKFVDEAGSKWLARKKAAVDLLVSPKQPPGYERWSLPLDLTGV